MNQTKKSKRNINKLFSCHLIEDDLMVKQDIEYLKEKEINLINKCIGI